LKKINQNKELKEKLDTLGNRHSFNFTKEVINEISKLDKEEQKNPEDVNSKDTILQKVIYFMSKKYEQEYGHNLDDIINKKTDFGFHHLYETYYNECKATFNRDHIYNIYGLITHFSEIYGLDESELKEKVENVIRNSQDLVYDDTINFLKAAKEQGYKICILTYCKENLDYQHLKLVGSGILDYVDSVVTTCKQKNTLDLNYSDKNAVFVDDKPVEVERLASVGASNIYRLAREGAKYSTQTINPKYSNIKTVTLLDEISFNEKKK